MQRKKLTRKERRKIVEDIIGPVPWDKFEPGIYNYCDRWCEKCKKTKKCFLYFRDKDRMIENSENGFVEIKEILSETKNLIETISKAEGPDISISKEDDDEFERQEKLTDPQNDPLYIDAFDLMRQIRDFIDVVDLFVVDEYYDAHNKVLWHHTMFAVKLARALSSQKEAKIERGMMRKFSLEDSTKSAYVSYRSLKICAESLDFMSRYLPDDSTADKLVLSCHDLLNKISLEFKL